MKFSKEMFSQKWRFRYSQIQDFEKNEARLQHFWRFRTKHLKMACTKTL